MARNIQPATPDQAICLDNALAAMRKAREWMKAANCPKALEALDSALKSAEGAKRHMGHRVRRTEEAAALENRVRARWGLGGGNDA